MFQPGKIRIPVSILVYAQKDELGCTFGTKFQQNDPILLSHGYMD